MKKQNLLRDTVSRSQNPLGSDERSSTKILVQGVDQGHLPAPFAGGSVVAADDTAAPVRAFHAAHVLIGHGVFQSGSGGQLGRLRGLLLLLVMVMLLLVRLLLGRGVVLELALKED